jgi:hypothetical protein
MSEAENRQRHSPSRSLNWFRAARRKYCPVNSMGANPANIETSRARALPGAPTIDQSARVTVDDSRNVAAEGRGEPPSSDARRRDPQGHNVEYSAAGAAT